MQKVKVAFICVHNSCRSQIAEALGRLWLKDIAEVYSAGTENKDKINSDAVRIVKQLYNIDMECNQKPKLIKDIPSIDYVITMGCNVECPYLPSKWRTDWGIEDPSGKSDVQFIRVIKTIEEKVNALRLELLSMQK